MKELQHKERFRRVLYSIPSLIILLLVAGLLVRGAFKIMVKRAESAERLRTLEAENEVLRARESSLKADIAHLETEEGVIDEIRAKFNVAREGERLAVIVDDEAPAATGTPSTLERGLRWLKSLWPF